MKDIIWTVRMDSVDESNLKFLKRKWKEATRSEVIRKALSLEVAAEKAQEVKLTKRQILEESGFLGNSHTDEQLSSTYKARLKQKIMKKHGK